MLLKHFGLFIFLFIFLSWANTSFAGATYSQAQAAFLSNDYQEVKKLANIYLSQNYGGSLAGDMRYLLGVSHLKLTEYELARKAFTKVLLNKSTHDLKDKAYLGLFDAYYLREDYNQALDTIRKLEKLSPRSNYKSIIFFKLARVNLKLANWVEARSYLNKILTHHPKSFETAYAKQLLSEKQYFAVQVGAFKDRQRAEEQIKELKKKKEYAYVVQTTDVSNRQFYRVRVGKIAKLEEARKLKLRLSKKGYPTKIYP
jgi:tetratricopeptide (TPR) repeat protein